MTSGFGDVGAVKGALNLDEVLRSVDVDPAAREGQTDHDKAAQARVDAHSGIAEHLRDA